MTVTVDRTEFDRRLAELESLDFAEQLEEFGIRTAAAAEEFVPVDTGELKQSIGYTVEDQTVTVFALAEHAEFIEYGTGKQPANPYLQPAMDENAPVLERLIRKRVQDV